MTGEEIFRFLKAREVEYLYHANTVATSRTFLQNGGLLSRGYIDSRGLIQTVQASDEDDKKLGIWNDIFFDTVDIHDHMGLAGASPGICFYGPVLFKFKIDVVMDSNVVQRLAITRTNPVKWLENGVREDYFLTLAELEGGFGLNDFGQHVMIRNQIHPLGFNWLEEIIVDNPFRDFNGKSGIDMVLEELKKVAPPGVEIRQRECRARCQCKETYEKMYSSKFKQKFF